MNNFFYVLIWCENPRKYLLRARLDLEHSDLERSLLMTLQSQSFGQALNSCLSLPQGPSGLQVVLVCCPAQCQQCFLMAITFRNVDKHIIKSKLLSSFNIFS